MKKKIYVVTGSRADYGLMQNLINKFHKDKNIDLKIFATGMHLSPEFGNTYKEILNDGFKIEKKIKHLRATFLQYAQERSIAGAWTEELKEDFEIIEALELDLNIRKRLLMGDMLLCNKLYKKYRVIYD